MLSDRVSSNRNHAFVLRHERRGTDRNLQQLPSSSRYCLSSPIAQACNSSVSWNYSSITIVRRVLQYFQQRFAISCRSPSHASQCLEEPFGRKNQIRCGSDQKAALRSEVSPVSREDVSAQLLLWPLPLQPASRKGAFFSEPMPQIRPHRWALLCCSGSRHSRSAARSIRLFHNNITMT